MHTLAFSRSCVFVKLYKPHWWYSTIAPSLRTNIQSVSLQEVQHQLEKGIERRIQLSAIANRDAKGSRMEPKCAINATVTVKIVTCLFWISQGFAWWSTIALALQAILILTLRRFGWYLEIQLVTISSNGGNSGLFYLRTGAENPQLREEILEGKIDLFLISNRGRRWALADNSKKANEVVALELFHIARLIDKVTAVEDCTCCREGLWKNNKHISDEYWCIKAHLMLKSKHSIFS